MPKLNVSLPDGVSEHDLEEDTITIGRVEDNALHIPDASVSSYHAQLTRDGETYILQDLGSTNGTVVNGREVAEGEDVRLGHGDAVTFGNISCSFSISGEPVSTPMPEVEEVLAAPATASARPAGFENASPFQTKKKGKDPAGMMILALAVVALLAFGGALMTIMQMSNQ